MSKLRKSLNSPLHFIYAHPRRFFLYSGILFLLFAVSRIVKSLDYFCFQSLVLMLGLLSIYRIWRYCDCGVLLRNDKLHTKRAVLLVQIPTILILLLSIVWTEMSESPVPYMLCSVWFFFLSAAGVSIFKTTKISSLEGMSLEEIDSIVDKQVLVDDIEMADKASQILLKEAEKLRDQD